MKLLKNGKTILMASALVILAGVLAAFLFKTPHFYLNSGIMVDFAEYGAALAAMTAFSLLYGFVRYNRKMGLVLAFAVLHDQLLSLALVSLLSFFMPQSSSLTALLVMGVVFTYSQTFPVLRGIQHGVKNPVRENYSKENTADQAVSQTASLRRKSLLAAALLLVAGAASGKVLLASYLLPVLVTALVSCLSASALSPWLWLSLKDKHKSVRVAR